LNSVVIFAHRRVPDRGPTRRPLPYG
jgi:hypothetical protein